MYCERVVHPAHVPFVGKAEPVIRDRLRDAGPGGRFLGDHHRAGTALGDDRVEMAQEADGFQILAPAVDVRHPFAGVAAVVAIEHRGDRIDAQSVDVEMLEPVQRAGDQEALHLAAAEIVDVGVPVLMEAFARIEMLVERGAVEAREAVRVGREMRRHPVEDDADAGRMQRIDEARKALRRAVARARREQAERLIAPRAAERMLGDRQQLDMGEAHVGEIRDQAVDRDVPQRRGARVVRGPHPRREMHLVDRERRVRRVARGARCASIRRRASGTARGSPPPRRSPAAARSAAPPDRPSA